MKYSQRIQELPPDERPYEKCLSTGPENLTDSELLAVILRSGTRGRSSVQLADQILHLGRKEQGLLGIYHLSMEELYRSNVSGNFPKGLPPGKPENFWIFTALTQLRRIIWNGCVTKSRNR